MSRFKTCGLCFVLCALGAVTLAQEQPYVMVLPGDVEWGPATPKLPPGAMPSGADAPPLGIAPALNGYAAGQTAMAPGDVLLIASDGFYEAADGEGTLFGQARVEAVLRENAGRPSSQMAHQLRAAVKAFWRARAKYFNA